MVVMGHTDLGSGAVQQFTDGSVDFNARQFEPEPAELVIENGAGSCSAKMMAGSHFLQLCFFSPEG